MEQIDPHACKEICDNLVKNNEIYGCGKPFKLFWNKNPTNNVVDFTQKNVITYNIFQNKLNK